MRTLALLATMALPQSGLALDPVKEGLWEINLQAEVGGQALSSTPLVVRQCLGSQSVQDVMTQLNGVAGGCQVSDFREESSRARWNMSCSGQISLSGTGEVVLGRETFNGTISMLVGIAGQTLPLLQSFNARWVGDCK